MDQDGDNNNGRSQRRPESGGGIPEPSLWDNDAARFSTFISGHDHQQYETSTYQDFFNILTNLELLSTPPLPLQPPPPPPPPSIKSVIRFEKGESSGAKRTSDIVAQVPYTPQHEVSTQDLEREDQQRTPRIRRRRRRSAQVHSFAERRRRGRINEKIKTLKELIPSCNKADKASVLTDVVERIKFLQQQVQMMCNYQSMLVQYYSSYFPMMGMGYGMSMCSSAYATSLEMLPFPQALNPFGESGFMFPASQLQYPLVESVLHNTASQPNMETMPIDISPTTANQSAYVTTLI